MLRRDVFLACFSPTESIFDVDLLALTTLYFVPQGQVLFFKHLIQILEVISFLFDSFKGLGHQFFIFDTSMQILLQLCHPLLPLISISFLNPNFLLFHILESLFIMSLLCFILF